MAFPFIKINCHSLSLSLSLSHTHTHTHTHTNSQGRNKRKCIEQKAHTDNEKSQSNHHKRDHTSLLVNTSGSLSSLPSSSTTTSSDELLPTFQSNVAHGSPMASSIGSVSSLSSANPLSASSSIPTSSPSYSPEPQLQSTNASPNMPSSALVTTCTCTSPADSNFSGVCDVPQTTWVSNLTLLQQEQPVPIDIAQVPIEGRVLYNTEIQKLNGVQSPLPVQMGFQSPPSVQNQVQSPPSVDGSIFTASPANSSVILPTQRNFSGGGSFSSDNSSPYNSPISTVSTHPSSV